MKTDKWILALLFGTACGAQAAVQGGGAAAPAFDQGAPALGDILKDLRQAAAGQPGVAEAGELTPGAEPVPPVFTAFREFRRAFLPIPFSVLGQLGVQGAAEDSALADCQARGRSTP
ncbi:MAG: hypothetical protein HY928_16160 [Elusimicrobia bacterium]|nr:hypothetical protein [Elusimicrobiota bacterium]